MTFSYPCYLDRCYLIFLAWLVAAVDYICTNFCVDSSSRFPFRVWTHRDAHTQNHRRHWSLYPQF